MKVYISREGNCHSIYDEQLDVRFLGCSLITRVSHVEPTSRGDWEADLGPIGGPRLGPFPRRGQAIKAEIVWLTKFLRRQAGAFRTTEDVT